jgi:hypothetical protein
MVSRYSIIRYVPDPIAGERINFGVIAFDDDQIQVRFLENWRRVQCFSQENIEFLKDFENRMKEATSSGLMVPGEESSALTRQERLLKISHDWQNSIQITPPRKSLGEVELVANQISGLFLKEPLPEVKSTLRDRAAAASITKVMVREVLKKRFKSDLVRNLLNQTNELPGKRESHQFDATVMNGKPYFAVQGISFEIRPPKHTTESVSWMISDVRDINSDIPLAVMVLPPKRNAEKYDELFKLCEQKIELYEDQGATILKEDSLGEWAYSQVEIISAH